MTVHNSTWQYVLIDHWFRKYRDNYQYKLYLSSRISVGFGFGTCVILTPFNESSAVSWHWMNYLTARSYRRISSIICFDSYKVHIDFSVGIHSSLVKLYHKINKNMFSVHFVTSRSWIFPNDNSIFLQSQMNKVDQRVCHLYNWLIRHCSFLSISCCSAVQFRHERYWVVPIQSTTFDWYQAISTSRRPHSDAQMYRAN